MKNTSRIPNGSATNGPETQAKTADISSPPEPGIEDGTFTGSSPVSLIIFDVRTDSTIAGLDISPRQLQSLRRLAKKSGTSLAGLLRAGLDHVLAAPGVGVAKYCPGKLWTGDFVQRLSALPPEEALKLAEDLQHLAQYLQQKVPDAAAVSKNLTAPNIPKGFVMVNLMESEQKELRTLAKECGMPLCHALRMALREMRFYLRERAKIARRTGWDIADQDRFLEFKAQSN